MQLKTVAITELKGINRNAVEGATQTQPTELKRFDFDRLGGYRVAGGNETITNSSSLDIGGVKATDNAGYIGYTDTGTSTSFPNGEVTLTIYNYVNDSFATEVYGFASGGPSTSDSWFDIVQYPRTGLLAYTGDIIDASTSYNAVFLIKKSDGTFFGSSDLYSGTYTVSATSTSSGSGSITTRASLYAGLPTDAGTFLAPIAAAQDSPLTATDEYEVSLQYTNAPSTWTVFMFGESIFTPLIQNNWYSLAPADSSGSVDISVTSASNILEDGGLIVQLQTPVELHNRRIWGRYLYPTDPLGTNNFDPVGIGANATVVAQSMNAFANSLPIERVLWYTEIGFANLMQPVNYLEIPFNVSTKITAVKSTPAGLLVFGDYETFLVRGDPANVNSFSVQLVSGVIGCDDGVVPAKLGGTVFSVHHGELYAITLGMGDVDFGTGIQKISDEIRDATDDIQAVAAEATYRQVVVWTDNDNVFRFDVDTQQWATDVNDGNTNIFYLSSGPDSTGVRIGLTSIAGTFLIGSHDSSGVTPTIVWEDVDLGSKDVTKMWRRVRIHTNDSYSGTPTLDYVINDTSGTITGSNETGNRWTFTLPSGLVNEKAEELQLNLVGAVEGDTIEPPVVIEYVERYRRR